MLGWLPQVPWPKGLDGVAVAEALAITMFKALSMAADEHDALQARFGMVQDSATAIKAIQARGSALMAMAGAPLVQYYIMGPIGASGAPSAGASGPFGNYWAEGGSLPVGTDTAFFLNGTSQLLLQNQSLSSQGVAYEVTVSE